MKIQTHIRKYALLFSSALFLHCWSLSVDADTYSQDFDDFADTSFTWTTVTNAEGWVVKDVWMTDYLDAYSDPNACYLEDLRDDDGQTGPSYIRSPLLSNGVGTISFEALKKKNAATVIEIQRSSDGSSWTNLVTITNSYGADQWHAYTNEIMLYEAVYLKFLKTSDSGESADYLAFDDIQITQPPAYLNVAGSQTTNMIEIAPDQWQAVIVPTGALVNPQFYFDSNEGKWGDADQTRTNLPVFGTAEPDETNILVAGTLTDPIAFLFNTTNLEYRIQPAEHVNFNTWTGAYDYGSYTNGDGWVIRGAQISDSGEVAQKGFAGQFCIMKYDRGDGIQYIKSPPMSNGLGRISFWYRNWNDAGTPEAEFVVEKSQDGATDWLPVNAGAQVTNITSAGYVYFSTPVSDPLSQYVRIRNVTNATDSWLCVDEIIVTEPGASVAFSNRTQNPVTPHPGESVDVSVDVSAYNDASNLTCTLYYQPTNSSGFSELPMTPSGDTYSVTVPALAPGLVQYYFRCTYDGFDATPAYYPAAASLTTFSYTVSSDLGYRSEDFDDFADTSFVWTTITNDEGWVVKDVWMTDYLDAYSDPNACYLEDLRDDDGQAGHSYIISPRLTNGVGTIYFKTLKKKTPATVIEVQRSADGASWTNLLTITNSYNADEWHGFTNEVLIYEDVYLKFLKTDDSGQSADYLAFDDIVLSPPPAEAAIAAVDYSPGYPASNQTVTISCVITSLHTSVPAVGFTPEVCHSLGGQGWQTNSMTSSDGTNFVATLPPHLPGEVSYFVRCNFEGFSYSYEGHSESRSPAYSPEAAPNAGMPDTFHSYMVRYYQSDYSDVVVTSDLGSADMDLIDDHYWQGIFRLGASTNQLAFRLAGFGFYSAESGYSSNTNWWGDDTQTRFTPPLAGTGQTNGANIVINGDFQGTNYFIVRYDLRNNSYLIARCAYQNFNEWNASTDYFEESIDREDVKTISNDFNAWPTNETYITKAGQDLEEFQSWEPDNYYASPTFAGSNGWYVNEVEILEEYNGNRSGRLSLDDDYDGSVWPHRSTLTRGLQTFSFDYRAMMDDHIHTYYTKGTNWDNYYVQAYLDAPDVSPIPYLSIFARYQDINNYYEYRLARKSSTQLSVAIYRRVAGVLTKIDESSDFTGSLQAKVPCRFVVVTNNGSSVYLEGYWNGSRKAYGTDFYDTGGTRIEKAGTIGFLTHGADIAVDDISLRHTTIQRFENWSAGSYGTYNNVGWLVTDCRPLNNYVRMDKNKNASIVSPELDYDPGYLSFRYWRYSGSNALLKVYGSTDGVSWGSPIATRSNFGTSASTFSTNGGLSAYNYIKIENASTAAEIHIEDIYITEATSFYTEDFSSGTASNWTAASHWHVNQADETYDRAGYVGPRVGFTIDTAYTNGTSATGTDAVWTNVASFGASNLNYQTVSTNIRYWDKLFVRVQHTSGNGSLVVDNLKMSSWAASNYTDAANWQGAEAWISHEDADTNNHQITLWRSRANPAKSQHVRTPVLSNGLSTLSFDYKADNLPVSFDVQWAPESSPDAFTTVETVTPTDTDWHEGYTVSVKTNRALYARIRHTSANGLAILTIDNLSAKDYAERSLGTWEAYNTLITHTENTREFEPYYTPETDFRTCYLNNSPTADTKDDVSLDEDLPYVQSSFLENGIGEIRFWYRNWQSSGSPAGKIYLRSSPVSTNAPNQWHALGSIDNITNTNYIYFSTNVYIGSDHYLRFYSETTSAARVCLDNILITEPLGADFEISDVRVVPTVPLHTNSVTFEADLTGFFMNPSNIQLRAFYNIGSNDWASWATNTYLQLNSVVTNGSTVTYSSTASIPTNHIGIDTVVQYFVYATFDGLFATNTSPKIHKDFTNPEWYYPIDLNAGQSATNPYYFVFSCLPDTVWINEVNYRKRSDETTNEYVEIVGPASTILDNWKIQLVDTDENIYDYTSITNGTPIDDDTNGFGFVVYGDPGVPNVDLVFTNPVDQNIAVNGGIRLVRSMGAYEQLLCYGDSGAAYAMTNSGYEYIGVKSSVFRKSPLYLEGSGDTYTNFNWTYPSSGSTPLYTPGAANVSQELVQQNQPPVVVDIIITDFWQDSTNTWLVFTGTNAWTPAAIYSTNLLLPGWTTVPETTNMYSNGEYTLWFENLTNSETYFFGVSTN